MAIFEQLQATLKNKNYTIVPNELCRLLNGDTVAAILLSRFIALYDAFMASGQLTEGGWFYQCVEAIEQELAITDHKQRSAIQRLSDLFYIDFERMGILGRRYVHLNVDRLLDDLSQLQHSEREQENEDQRKNFYLTLNAAWELKDFYMALDKIPPDIGEFMYAWTHAFTNTKIKTVKFLGPLWKWTSRDFGMLNQYWNTTYRKIRHFDYDRLQKYFLKDHPEGVSIGDFIAFDKITADRFVITSLSSHLKKDDSIFK